MRNIEQLALLSPNLKLRSQAVVNVLESRRSAAISKHIICDSNNASLRLRPADAIPGRSQAVDRRPPPQLVEAGGRDPWEEPSCGQEADPLHDLI